MRAFKVSYDDSIVKFYDSRSREIKTSIVNVQKCTTDQADISKGINAFKLKDGFTLVTDAKHLGGKDQGRYYRWYAKASALLKEGLMMNSTWKPAFVVVEKGMFTSYRREKDEFTAFNVDEDTNLLVVANIETSILLRSAEMKSPDDSDPKDCREKDPTREPTRDIAKDLAKSGMLVMPLLETIVNIFPIFSGKSLKAICIDLQGEYADWMENKVAVMNNLFEFFKERFNAVSQKEACSFAELHECLFENTFRMSLHQKPTSSLGYDGTSSLFLADRVMFVKSAFVSSECFGDIPWHFADDKETLALRASSPITVFNDVFAFAPAKMNVTPKSDSIKYAYVFIFPAMEIEGKSYPYGSFLAMHPSSQVDFYGPLFEDISPREEIYIDSMFTDHINRLLKRESNPHDLFKRRQLPTRCRHSLIEKIKDCFLGNKKPI